MGRIIGIDLGTTNSCVAVVEGGAPVVIPNAEGARTTPSIIGYQPSGDRLVGQVAKRQAVQNPEHTVVSIKRVMGRSFESEEARKQVTRVAYRIVRSPNGDAWAEVHGRQLSPPEVSAAVLMEMKSVAEAYLREEVTEAVITVPAYFDDAQRQATKDAGKIAGLDVRRIINEPTAAALAYGLDRNEDERIAVYDLGGGTFDISILEITRGVFRVVSTNGDTFLGGDDFDQRIIDLLAEEFQQEHGTDLRANRLALQRLREAAEKAKHELSSSLETEVNLPFIASTQSGPAHLLRTLKRTELERLVDDLIEATMEPCRKALADARLGLQDIHQIVLVGGMTRMPLVQKRVTEFFGRAPHKGLSPDEVVAVGAAIQAASISGELESVLLLDVTPLSLGVETAGGVMTTLIPRNTTIPTRRAEIFSTSLDNQTFVPIHVLQGEREMAGDNRSLYHFELTGIPPAPRGLPKIEVTFEIDANGILSVTATDMATKKSKDVRIVAGSGLSQQDVDRLVEEAMNFKQDDLSRREYAELRSNAEAMLFTTENASKEYGDLLDAALRDQLGQDMANLRAALDEGSDLTTLRELLAALEASAYKIAESMYGSAGA
ncbi:MAG: molecular chaperone DnaK [Deltaproteobacteria bacterium]|nr:molecular chaperone DnaK [Deltaproteobacteria bacterium]